MNAARLLAHYTSSRIRLTRSSICGDLYSTLQSAASWLLRNRKMHGQKRLQWQHSGAGNDQ